MIKRLSRLAAGAFAVALGASLIAQGGAGAASPSLTLHPKYAVLHTAGRSANVQPAAGLTTFTYKYTYKLVKYHDTFVGTNPATGAPTTVPVDLIPVKLTLGATVKDPTAGGSSSPLSKTLASPIFNSSIDFVQGGTNVGTTQYIDAVERANLWNKVSTLNPGYHVLFGTPTVEPTVSLTVPSSEGVVASYNGLTVIVANINWYDPQVQAVLTADGIPASTLPVFVTADSFLSNNSGTSGCCIGGYHNYNGTQTYADFNYLTGSGFSQDVSALSHEAGEWVNDPYTNNIDVPAACGLNGNRQRIYETGDPLENEANFGDYAYTVGGMTWHLQDLVTPVYFGAPAKTSVNHWDTFQGTPLAVCQNGG
jgi:hypothetical protein